VLPPRIIPDFPPSGLETRPSLPIILFSKERGNLWKGYFDKTSSLFGEQEELRVLIRRDKSSARRGMEAAS